MNKQLLNKYFRNQCSLEETEQVLNWFRTEEGKAFFEESLDHDMQRYADDERLLLIPDIPSDAILQRIHSTKKRKRTGYKFYRKQSGRGVRIAVAALFCMVLAGSSYFVFQSRETSASAVPETALRTITTQSGQQRLVTLSDGTRIRLNSNSEIVVPERFPGTERSVTLYGEAWFEVSQDQARPFFVDAGRASIRVLGTEFNVRIDSLSRSVQVAVAEGTVSLSSEADSTGRGALLTRNTFAMLHTDSREILIEQSPVENYLSWMSGRLYFYNNSLREVSRYLERIYNVSVRYEDTSLEELTLSTDMAREDLPRVLDIIARTLGIRYSYSPESNTVLWTDNINQ